MADTVPGLVRRAAEEFGDSTAYAIDGTNTTFAELREQVCRTAAVYRSMGLQTGGRVVLWAPNSLEWVVAGLAVTYAGGTLVPANSRYTEHEVVDLVDRTDAALVIIADGFLGRTQIADLRALSPDAPIIDISDLATLADQVDPALVDEVDAIAAAVGPDDIADILFTSGTSGKPKGVLSAQRQTVARPRAGAPSARSPAPIATS